MEYISTRDAGLHFTSAQAIVQGLSREGGLFLPKTMPHISTEQLEQLMDMTYQQRAVHIMKLFLDDFTVEELTEYADKAYAFGEKFDAESVTPILQTHCKTHVLELWHGPTCAFKDMALQMLPYLLTASLKKTGETKTVCILVATSGDTGKAALEGFCDVPDTKILVFYPRDGVSEIQKLQMVTQEGDNVGVCSVLGNFDDAQTGVKHLFSKESLRKELEEKGYFLSSANSINWGRVLPQIVYYVSSYVELMKQGNLKMGETLNVCVPTGNFGNILAAYYAKSMGVPLGKLICASNANNVLTDFIRTGIYDRNRGFYTTTSPSMDILISSNLERLLYLICQSDEQVKGYMQQLNETGKYEVSDDIKKVLQETFACGSCDDARTLNTIGKNFTNNDYLMDTHTAVAYTVLMDYRVATADDTTSLVVSTASPFKFSDSVLCALGETNHAEGTAILGQLTEKSGRTPPAPLARLEGKNIRFDGVTEKENLIDVVRQLLN